jgi:glycine/D-amino acid oxidase-like deaminating enzyme
LAGSADVVICGAGIAGIAAAYHLSVKCGIRDVVLVDERPPLSLTSDKSTECYRNWWPGPGDAMVQMMNHSIDLIEELARESNNAFHLNRRGYLYATAQPQCIEDLRAFAGEASRLGAGPVRTHEGRDTLYQPAPAEGFEGQPLGADLLLDQELIHDHFPYLSEEIVGLLHVRRAGWFSAQQYGAYLLDRAREQGVSVISARVLGVQIEKGKAKKIDLSDGGSIATDNFVIAAGPFIREVAALVGVEIPVYQELHVKASINDAREVIPREAPLVIYSDPQRFDWDEEERQMLAADEETRWLTETLPSGVHTRPEGGTEAQSILLLWDYHNDKIDPVVPPPVDPFFAELALRGLCRVIPGLEVYLGKMPKPFVDGGYYTKTRENRPLACPLPVEGVFLIGAMAGYGIMASAALGELVAAHATQGELPEYAPAFDLARYEDPVYRQLLENWGDSWQL